MKFCMQSLIVAAGLVLGLPLLGTEMSVDVSCGENGTGKMSLPSFDAGTITGDELVALCAKIGRPLTVEEVDGLRNRLCGRRMSFTFRGRQVGGSVNGNAVYVGFPDTGRSQRKAYLNCRFDFQDPSAKRWDWDEHGLSIRGTLVSDKEKVSLMYGDRSPVLVFKNAVLDRSKASNECCIPEFCGVHFGKPTLMSTNGLVRCESGKCSRSDGRLTVEYGFRFWRGVVEGVRPTAFFDLTIVNYTFKTLTPYRASFFGHFPKGATRAECLAVFDSFVAEMNQKYPVNLRGNDQFRNAVEPEGFVPGDLPTNLSSGVERYRPCRKFGECFGRYEGEMNGCPVWVQLYESACGERVVEMVVDGYNKEEAYRSGKLDAAEIEGLLSYVVKDAKMESCEVCRAREDEREKFRLRYGFVADVLFVEEDVKAGTILTEDKLQRRDYVGMGILDRCLRVEDLKSILGRRVVFDLKRGSILLKTDLSQEGGR